MRSKYKILILALFSAVHFFCSEGTVEKNVVATVDDEKITFSELEISFLLEPQYMKRMPLGQARRNQLDYLVQQKYYYLAAEERDLQSEPLLQCRIRYIKDTEIRKDFINEKFLKTVKISPQETHNGLNRLAEKRQVQNFFTADSTRAADLLAKLQSGALDPDRFFAEQGEDLDYISFGDLDQVVEDAVYGLDTLVCSPLIRSPYGYHILRVTDIVENPDFKNLNDRLRLQQVNDIIRKRKADALIRGFLEKEAVGAKIQVNNRVLGILLSFVKSSGGEREVNPTTIVPPVTNRELINIGRQLTDLADQPLVRFKEEELSAGTFIERLKEMPPFHRPYIKGRTFLLKSILDMMRSDLLLSAARREGYEKKESVREDYRRQIGDFLGREFGLRLNSVSFRQQDSLAWQAYQQTYLEVKEENELTIYPDHLFGDGARPDSVMTAAPVPVFLKNRYVW